MKIKEIKNIIKGHVNEALSSNEDLHQARMSICEQCPLLLKSKVGWICNPNLFMKIDENEEQVIEYRKDGYTKGCGCRLNAKTRLPESKCPVNKW